MQSIPGKGCRRAADRQAGGRQAAAAGSGSGRQAAGETAVPAAVIVPAAAPYAGKGAISRITDVAVLKGFLFNSRIFTQNK